MPAPARILILGGGFGGLYTALVASRLLRTRAEITVIDRNDYFLYTPLLFQVAGGSLQARHVARSLRHLLPRSARIIHADVTAIDLDTKQVTTGSGSLSYDFLVLALGGVPNFYGMASAEQHALRFKWLPDVFRLR
ncbi:MAG: FAD-dependent oxidoreductase, partial [Acidimicrobiia bacterium]